MKENNLLVCRGASSYIGAEGTNGCRAQRHDVCRGMTAVIAGGMLFISIWCVVNITDYITMFSNFINVTVKRPHRAVADGAENEPYHEEAFEHAENLPETN